MTYKKTPNFLKGIMWIIAGLFFIASVWYIIHYFHWVDIMGVFKIFKPGYYYLGAGSITLCYWVVRTLRWAVIFKRNEY